MIQTKEITNDSTALKHANKILDFIVSNAPFGSSNYGLGKEAKDKFLLTKSGASTELNFERLGDDNVTPWNGPTEGLKSVIAGLLQARVTKREKYVIASAEEVIQTAHEVYTYGTGRCIGLACLGFVYALKELDSPGICLASFKGGLDHALLFLLKPNANPAIGFTFNDIVAFCDPWTRQVGDLKKLFQLAQEVEFDIQSIILSSLFNHPASQEKIKGLVRDVQWPVEQQKKTFLEINATYQAFLDKNRELQLQYANFEAQLNQTIGKQFIEKYIDTKQACWQYFLDPHKSLKVKLSLVMKTETDFQWFAAKLKKAIPSTAISSLKVDNNTRYQLLIDVKKAMPALRSESNEVLTSFRKVK